MWWYPRAELNVRTHRNPVLFDKIDSINYHISLSCQLLYSTLFQIYLDINEGHVTKDFKNVVTIREMYEQQMEKMSHLEYHRLPVPQHRTIEEKVRKTWQHPTQP